MDRIRQLAADPQPAMPDVHFVRDTREHRRDVVTASALYELQETVKSLLILLDQLLRGIESGAPTEVVMKAEAIWAKVKAKLLDTGAGLREEDESVGEQESSDRIGSNEFVAKLIGVLSKLPAGDMRRLDVTVVGFPGKNTPVFYVSVSEGGGKIVKMCCSA